MCAASLVTLSELPVSWRLRMRGSTTFYEGERGYERQVRHEYPDGTVQYYTGERYAERLESIRYPEGFTRFSATEHGQFRKVRYALPVYD